MSRTVTPAGPVYRLTPAGNELGDVCLSLGAWAARWRDARPADKDPYLVLWMLARMIDPSSLPHDRVVVRFEITDRSPSRYWLVAGRTDVEVCAEFPGFTEDGVVITGTEWLVRWHTGRVGFAAAVRAGGMVFAGPRWLALELSRWGELSPYAAIAASRTEDPRTSQQPVP